MLVELDKDFNSIVQELQTELTNTGVELRCEKLQHSRGLKYALRGPNTFAWIEKRPRLNCLAICTKMEWANRARVNDYQCKQNSWFNEPGAHWLIPMGDTQEIKKVAKKLACVCTARHSARRFP